MPEHPDKGQDEQYEDYLVIRVLPTSRGWIITLDPMWSVAIPRGPVEPKEGDLARLYGLGVGFRVRGVDIKPAGEDWQEMYYRSAAEESQRPLGASVRRIAGTVDET